MTPKTFVSFVIFVAKNKSIATKWHTSYSHCCAYA